MLEWSVMKITPFAIAFLGIACFGFQGDQANTPLTPETLGKVLTSAGFEVKLNGTNSYTLTVKDQGNTIPITASLSSGKTNFWLQVQFGKLDSSDLSNAAWLSKVLHTTEKISPGFFYLYDTTDKSGTTTALWVDYPYQNTTSDPAVIKKEINDFAGVISDTVDVWIYPSKSAKTTTAGDSATGASAGTTGGAGGTTGGSTGGATGGTGGTAGS